MPPRKPLNVILFGIDSLRADHLSSYGYERETSPFLDGLAAEGVRFENAISTTSWTLPSMATLLLFFTHGVQFVALKTEGEMRERARAAVHAHATMTPGDRGAMAPALRALLGSVGRDVWIEAPCHVAYGINLHLGDGVYLNAGCVVLDTAPVRIGAATLLGPGVHIYCAEHHHDRASRAAGLEIARPVTIGAEAWIGGGAILLPGVRVGDGAIVGAGSVVTRNVAAGATVVGNPARARQV